MWTGGLTDFTPLLADAKSRKDFAQQVVGRELAGDRRERALRAAQFLGKELDRRRTSARLRCRRGEMIRRLGQRRDLPVTGEECILDRMLDTGKPVDFGFEQRDAFAGQRAQPDVWDRCRVLRIVHASCRDIRGRDDGDVGNCCGHALDMRREVREIALVVNDYLWKSAGQFAGDGFD